MVESKRKRTYGTFSCTFTGCGRAFTRADHLSRHQKNHDPSRKLACTWPGCSLVFSRNDVREKHLQRHAKKDIYKKSSASQDVTDKENISLNYQEHRELANYKENDLTALNYKENHSIDKHNNTQSEPSYQQNSYFDSSSSNYLQSLRDPHSATYKHGDASKNTCSICNRQTVPGSETHMCSNGHNTTHFENKLVIGGDMGPPSIGKVEPRDEPRDEPSDSPNKSSYSQLLDESVSEKDQPLLREESFFPSTQIVSQPDPALDQLQIAMTPINKPLSPSDLIEWLFHDDSISKGDKIPPSEFHNFPNEVSPVSSLIENVFAITPQFPHSSTRDSVDELVRQDLISRIPSLSLNQDFGLTQIERCLEIYWATYHPQYPILHRPSFSNQEAHPLLLLAMIMVGASLVSCSGKKEDLFVAPQKLAEHIAEPLRWLIFSNPDCKPPANLYIVQSLLLLESFEITSTSRFLHERSFLYHGTKIQLLRRSPILGGDPLKQNVEDQDPQLWKQWIEFESMKRACLMAFYLDTVNSTVYGHTLILYAYQIKLSLPCEDSLWEYDNEHSKIDSISKFQSPKFLDALKGLLHRKHIQTSTFGKSILLAGLLTIMFQMQQKDLQLSFLEWDTMKESWNEIISIAVDVWRVEVCPNGCFDTRTAFHFPEKAVANLPPMLRYEDTRCKFSLYHVAQIYMRITHYDYIVYAGAPSRMNVKVTENEYQNVENRVKEWANSMSGCITVVHAYLFLFEMLLSPNNDDICYLYDPNTDPFLHRKNIVASAVLVIFAYNFSLYGKESNFFGSLEGDDFYPNREDGHSYLRRIRKQFLNCISGSLHKQYHDSMEYHAEIKIFAANLKNIENKHHIAGLLKIFYQGFKESNWEVGREYSNLFKNCIERCLGRETITCVNMYE